jgi:hypothetical protein
VPIAAALEQPPGDLRMEIAAVRAVLAELLEAELPAETLANVVDRATNALVRLMRANKSLAEKQDEADQAALDVLRDLGQGER